MTMCRYPVRTSDDLSTVVCPSCSCDDVQIWHVESDDVYGIHISRWIDLVVSTIKPDADPIREFR